MTPTPRRPGRAAAAVLHLRDAARVLPAHRLLGRGVAADQAPLRRTPAWSFSAPPSRPRRSRDSSSSASTAAQDRLGRGLEPAAAGAGRGDGQAGDPVLRHEQLGGARPGRRDLRPPRQRALAPSVHLGVPVPAGARRPERDGRDEAALQHPRRDLRPHAKGFAASLAAVTLGGRIVERHVTLSRRMYGPDAALSLEPEDLARLVREIRELERMLASPVRQGCARGTRAT